MISIDWKWEILNFLVARVKNRSIQSNPVIETSENTKAVPHYAQILL
jgi:hypothetical protein